MRRRRGGGRAVAMEDAIPSGGDLRAELGPVGLFILVVVVARPRVERRLGDRLRRLCLTERLGLRYERVGRLLGLVVLLLAPRKHLDVRGDDLGLPVAGALVVVPRARLEPALARDLPPPAPGAGGRPLPPGRRP